jgi:hypothetical protein
MRSREASIILESEALLFNGSHVMGRPVAERGETGCQRDSTPSVLTDGYSSIVVPYSGDSLSTLSRAVWVPDA